MTNQYLVGKHVEDTNQYGRVDEVHDFHFTLDEIINAQMQRIEGAIK